MNEKKNQNRYEVLFITKKVEDTKINQIKKNIEKSTVFENFKFSIWKEISPAYKIKDIEKTEIACYYLMNFECLKENVFKVEEILKSSPEIRRYRIINISRDSKKMKISKIKSPKPRIRKKYTNFQTNQRNKYVGKENPVNNLVQNSKEER